MMRLRIIAAAAGLLAATAVRGATYTYDAETQPAITDVHFGAWQLYGGPAAWTTDYARSPTHSLDLTGGISSTWMRQELSDGINYIAADFYALAPNGPAPAKAIFDFGEQPIVAGPDWTANTYVVRSFPYSSAARFSFVGAGVYLDDVTFRSVTRAEAAVIQDANFAALMPKPFNYVAPDDRYARIPIAEARLASGQQLNVLMVGDSIINNTFNSFFDSLVDRHYSGAQLVVKKSVEGAPAPPIGRKATASPMRLPRRIRICSCSAA